MLLGPMYIPVKKKNQKAQEQDRTSVTHAKRRLDHIDRRLERGKSIAWVTVMEKK